MNFNERIALVGSVSLTQNKIKPKIRFLGLALILTMLVFAEPVLAHHAIGGQTPDNLVDGFLSGLAHPVIGADHLVFVIAVGLLAALKNNKGILIPVAFVVATVAGTGVHLLGVNLPVPEILISASVLVLGIVLAIEKSSNLICLIGSVFIVGIFHGYAYGEAIVGAEMTPLTSYLAGFTLIQLVISFLAFKVGKLIRKIPNRLSWRFTGLAISAVGTAFLCSNILG